MPKRFKFNFPTIYDAFKKWLNLDKYEVGILWFIMKNKTPVSMYSLFTAIKNKKFYFPKGMSKATITTGDVNSYIDETDKPMDQEYPRILKILKGLECKGLIKLEKDKTNPRENVIPKPTFEGYVYFLKNCNPKNDFTHFLINHKDNLLILQHWEAITKIIDADLCVSILLEQAYNFSYIKKVKFQIRRPSLVFDGLLENSTKSDFGLYPENVYGKNSEMFEFLKTEVALDLKNSYIAYLASKDIEHSRWIESGKLESIIPDLISEKEFQLLCGNKQSSLYNGETLKEFFPKYAGIEYFFTGMFIRDLVWSEKRESLPKYDFRVSFTN